MAILNVHVPDPIGSVGSRMDDVVDGMECQNVRVPDLVQCIKSRTGTELCCAMEVREDSGTLCQVSIRQNGTGVMLQNDIIVFA